jgi:hypothetical protein
MAARRNRPVSGAIEERMDLTNCQNERDCVEEALACVFV